jgi:hypothetical protein
MHPFGAWGAHARSRRSIHLEARGSFLTADVDPIEPNEKREGAATRERGPPAGLGKGGYEGRRGSPRGNRRTPPSAEFPAGRGGPGGTSRVAVLTLALLGPKVRTVRTWGSAAVERSSVPPGPRRRRPGLDPKRGGPPSLPSLDARPDATTADAEPTRALTRAAAEAPGRRAAGPRSRRAAPVRRRAERGPRSRFRCRTRTFGSRRPAARS